MVSKLRTVLSVCLYVCLLVILLAVYTTLRQANPSAVSQAQGYPPPPETTPPGEQNNSGYPGPEFVFTTPIPTSPPPIFTPSSIFYLPLLNRNLPAKKGMVWHYYPVTNVDPWNAMNIGWFYRYAPSNGPLTNVHGPIEYIPFWTCSWHDVDWMLTQVPTGYDGYFMWINEPNTGPEFPGGCTELNDVNLAAQFYILSRANYPNAKFIGPHTYHGNDQAHQQAMQWVDAWRDRVEELSGEYPDVTGYGIHPYNTDRERNLRYVDEYYAMMVGWGEANKELWVTEFTYCNVANIAEDIQYTVNGFENRPYVDRYAYWVDYRVTPVPSSTPTPTATPGANEDSNNTTPPTVPLGWCIDPGRTISLFDPAVPGYNTLTAAGEAYRQVGR